MTRLNYYKYILYGVLLGVVLSVSLSFAQITSNTNGVLSKAVTGMAESASTTTQVTEETYISIATTTAIEPQNTINEVTKELDQITDTASSSVASTTVIATESGTTTQEVLITANSTPQLNEVVSESLDTTVDFTPESINDCRSGPWRMYFSSPGHCVKTLRSLF